MALSTASVSSNGGRFHGNRCSVPDVISGRCPDPKGPSEGRLLAMEKRHVEGQGGMFDVIVDQEPKKAGIDPFNKLIDRDPDDNLVSVVAGSPPERLAGN